jgi:2-oxoglutarate ferredoxin oxidoreductase subunit beta
VAPVEQVGIDSLVVHDVKAENPTLAFALSQLEHLTAPARTAIGVFRAVERPTYDDLLNDQIHQAVDSQGAGDLGELLRGTDTWVVG